LFLGPIILTVSWAVWREWAANLYLKTKEKTNLEEKPLT
jgi:hypothetical protein